MRRGLTVDEDMDAVPGGESGMKAGVPKWRRMAVNSDGERRNRVAARMRCPIAVVVLSLGSLAMAQVPYRTAAGEMLLVESAAAARVAEKVRAGAPGVLVEVFVKPGETVRKGQVLGHMELESTKLQLDLAEHALNGLANVEAAQAQAEAWTVTREETEEAVRKRRVDRTRLDWALAMEKVHRANHQAQLDAEKTQLIQYEYWKDQYEKRFFRAPVDGVVTEVMCEVAQPLGVAAHVFTVSNESVYSIPVVVPAPLAGAALPSATLPVRAADGKSVAKGQVDTVTDDPRGAGHKIIRLLVKAADFPAAIRPKLIGMKFDVLMPELADGSTE